MHYLFVCLFKGQTRWPNKYQHWVSVLHTFACRYYPCYCSTTDLPSGHSRDGRFRLELVMLFFLVACMLLVSVLLNICQCPVMSICPLQTSPIIDFIIQSGNDRALLNESTLDNMRCCLVQSHKATLLMATLANPMWWDNNDDTTHGFLQFDTKQRIGRELSLWSLLPFHSKPECYCWAGLMGL